MANLTAGSGRYDKYDPISGGFRAALGADLAASATPVGVGLDSNGDVVVGAGATGIVGVICLTKNMKDGQRVDVMTAGEIVDIAGVTAGDVITALTTTGVLSNTAADATHVPIGFTVEADRLVVRKGVPTFDAT